VTKVTLDQTLLQADLVSDNRLNAPSNSNSG